MPNIEKLFSHTHIVAVEIQNTDGFEFNNEVRDNFDLVHAQVQFINVAQLLQALWHHGELLATQVKEPFLFQSHLQAALNHFQGHRLLFLWFGQTAVEERCKRVSDRISTNAQSRQRNITRCVKSAEIYKFYLCSHQISVVGLPRH